MIFQLTNTRLFTFGCSFTQYIWPTWADILSKNFKFYENWALAGAGNLYIFNSIIEANKRHCFNKEDTIIIMWSGLTRIDYYKNNSWQPQGGDFEFKHNDITGVEVINYAYIDSIKSLFDSLGLNYKMLCLTPYTKNCKSYDLYKDSIDSLTLFPYKTTNKTVSLNLSDLKNTYFYDLIKGTYDRNAGSDWPKFDDYWNNTSIVKNIKIQNEIKNCISAFTEGYNHLQKSINLVDSHPIPYEHLTAVTKLFPNYVLSNQTENWVKEFNNTVCNGVIVPYTTNRPKNRL